ncbi:MAG: DNA methylase [Oscillospiraceae bacterium]|nr:DNA methylase [Oscillospiraceae bacterium]
MAKKVRQYVAIDAKSFYASVECVERHLNPMTTNLVVTDESRTEKTICLAVSPSLKAHGIPGRARLFEVIQRMKEVNRERLNAGIRSGATRRDPETRKYQFSASSFDAEAIEKDPTLEISYIVAPPRMRLYEEYSSQIYATYLKYVSSEDIIVYSIDEVFIDVTDYLRTYGMTAHELTMTMVRDVLYNTGITATAGIGTNLFLAKIAMDIEAKKSKPDKDGVRIAALDEMTFREKLWTHRPLTDFWRIGKGISQKLEAMQLFTLGDVARASLNPYCEDRLYKTFGVNAELIIDHAWGWEPVTVEDIRQYRPSTSSISSGQVLQCPYDFEKGRLIVREMTELLVLDLVRKHVVTKQIVLDIGYDRESLEGERGRKYTGSVVMDPYGRKIPKAAHGTGNMDGYTSSTHVIMSAVLDVYDRVVHKDLLIRRVNVTACNLVSETEIPEDKPEQLDMFTDYEALEQEKKARQLAEEKERRLQNVTLAIQDKFGKNAMLKGMNLMEGGTTIARNGQIGGHKAGDE